MAQLTDTTIYGDITVTGVATISGTITGDVTGDVTGDLTGDVTGNVSGSSGSCTGLAATATALATARTIGGVSFDGTANTTVASATGGFTVTGALTGDTAAFSDSANIIATFTSTDAIAEIRVGDNSKYTRLLTTGVDFKIMPNDGAEVAVFEGDTLKTDLKGALDVAGDIAVTGTVDGVDIAGSINQAVLTTSTPTFSKLTLNGTDCRLELQDTTGDHFRIQNQNGIFKVINETDSDRVDFTIDGNGKAYFLGDVDFSANIIVDGTVDGIDIAAEETRLANTSGTNTGDDSGVTSVAGGTGLTSTGGDTPSLSVTADSIGDTQLTFNTGQHLTTTSSPTFTAITAGNLLNSADATDYIDMDTSGWIRFKLNSTSVLSLNDTQVIALADVVPNTDSTYSLGTTANRWSNFFTDAITCGGNIAVGGTVDGIDIATDVGANNSKVTNATHSGEVTGSTALTIAANVVDEANMKISNGPTNDYILTADSGATGGWKWAEAGGGADDSARTSAGLNLIRELQDRSVTFSADGADMFGDAYIDTTGRMNYVDTGETDATFDTNKYRPATSAQYWSSAGGDTLSTTYVTMATFSNAGILVQEVQYSQYRTGSNTTTAYGKVIFTYTDDSTAEDEQSTTSTNTPVVRTITNPNLAKLVKSVSFQAKTSDGGRQAYMNAITLDNVLPTEFLIYHDIPTGTFGATISSAHATALVADWEAGADIQFKLTGTSGTEDSGWLDYNTTTDFTAFTAEPDTFIVKLVAKTTSPTPGYPAIHGAIVKAE